MKATFAFIAAACTAAPTFAAAESWQTVRGMLATPLAARRITEF